MYIYIYGVLHSSFPIKYNLQDIEPSQAISEDILTLVGMGNNSGCISLFVDLLSKV